MGVWVACLLCLQGSSAPVSDQETVKLRNGRYVTGTFHVDPAHPDGFTAHPWDTDGVLHIRFNQLAYGERERLEGRSAELLPKGETLLSGVRVTTWSREVVGVLVSEDAEQFAIKTRDGKSPIVIPAKAVLQRIALSLHESDVYSADERVDRRLAQVGRADRTALLEIGRFATQLKLYERAKSLYQEARAADPSGSEEIDELLVATDLEIAEGKAAKLLGEIHQNIQGNDFARAITNAKRLVSEYGQTRTAQANKDLERRLEEESREWATRRSVMLARKVPEAYKLEREAAFSRYADPKYKISDLKEQVTHLDEEIRSQLARKLNSAPEEIAQAWEKREMKERTASYGAGSWIPLGGQSGGLDTSEQAQIVPPGFVYDEQSDGDGNTYRVRRKPDPVTVALGKPIPTQEEWWAGASRWERREWVEAEYAQVSQAVQKTKLEPRKCSLCHGEGAVRVSRSGVGTTVVCPRCHGTKQDLVLRYE